MSISPQKEIRNITPLLKDTLLVVIENSVGSKMFRTSYALVDGQKTDILRNGQLSCAFFVSSVLVMCGLIKTIHATVSSTVKDLLDSGWTVVEVPKPGSVLVWEVLDFGAGGMHGHVGFYIGDGKAISNNDTLGYPTVHDWTFDSKRNVEQILWHPKLD